MARGSKKKYTSKQKRKASKIERGYKEARRQQQGSGTPRMGNCKQVRSRWPEEGRERTREKAKQIKFPQGWKKRRSEIKDLT
jgi:hypothetical protein